MNYDWIWAIVSEIGKRLGLFVLILVAGILIIKLVMSIVNKILSKSKLEKAGHNLIGTLIRTVLTLLLGLMAAASLGIDVTGVIALASVLTLALSLSLQDLLTNIIGGFTLLNTRPFGSGDFVEIAGEAGTVSEIGLTYTKLVTSDNKLIYIPNNSVVTADIINYSDSGTRRVELNISVSYDAPTEQVFAALLDTARVPGVMEDPAPFVAIAGFRDSAIEYTLRVWTATEDYWNVTYAMNQRVRECFAQHGVDMTYPHLNIHLDK